MSNTWPVILTHGDVTLRPIRLSDGRQWQKLRDRNMQWLREWDATSPLPQLDPPPTFRQNTRDMLREARLGQKLPFIVEFQGVMCGQLTVSNITAGAHRGANFGYWIAEEYSGRGIMTTAGALVTDYLLGPMKLHRVEIAVRPENVPSNRLAQRLGFEFEGVRKKFLHINNAWRDHNVYVMYSEIYSDSLLNRLKKNM